MCNKQNECKVENPIKYPFYVKHFACAYFISIIAIFIVSYIVFSLTDFDEVFKILLIAFHVMGIAGFIIIKNSLFYHKHNTKAIKLINNADLQLAADLLDQLLKYPSKKSPAYCVIMMNKTLVLFYLGLAEEAINGLKSLKLSKKALFRFVYYNNLAFFYYCSNQTELANENYLKSVFYSKKLNKKSKKMADDLIDRNSRVLTNNLNYEENYQFFLNEVNQPSDFIRKLNDNFFLAKFAYQLGKKDEAIASLEFIINSNTNTIFSIYAREMLQKIK